MRFYFVSVLLALASLFNLNAADSPDPLVNDQLRADYLELSKQQPGGQATQEQHKAFADKYASQTTQAYPTAFSFTADELKSLHKNLSLFTDAEVKAAYSRLKSAAQSRPMPVVVEFYKTIYDSGKMNAIEQAIFVKLTLSIAAKTEKETH